MRNAFSSSIDESLAGRTQNTAAESQSARQVPSLDEPVESIVIAEDVVHSETDQKGRLDKGLGKNADGSFKQSNAGRPSMAKAKKKLQVTLTLTPATKEALDTWATTKPRSATSYVSEYVEEHLEEIMNYFNR